MCMYSSVSCDKVEYTHMSPLHRSTFEKNHLDRTLFSDLNLHFQVSKLNFRFQINSNEFSRDGSFGHKCVTVLSNKLKNNSCFQLVVIIFDTIPKSYKVFLLFFLSEKNPFLKVLFGGI